MIHLESKLGLYYEFGPFRLDPGEHRFYRDGEIILLPPKEFDLLLLLVKSSGKIMDRESLIKALWPRTVVEEANLNVHISALRKTLGEKPDEYRYIETIPRLGYRFIAPVIEVNTAAKIEAQAHPFKNSSELLFPPTWTGDEKVLSLDGTSQQRIRSRLLAPSYVCGDIANLAARALRARHSRHPDTQAIPLGDTRERNREVVGSGSADYLSWT